MPRPGLFSIVVAVSALLPGVAAAVEWHAHYEGHSEGAWAGWILAILGILMVLGFFFLLWLIIRAIAFGIRRLTRRAQSSAPDAPDTLRQTDSSLAAAAGRSDHRVDAVADPISQRDITGLSATGKEQAGVDPDKILNLEKSVYRVARPFAWFLVARNTLLCIIFIPIWVMFWLFFAKINPAAKFIAIPLLVFGVLGAIVSAIGTIYRAWAFSRDPTAKMNVVFKPVEILQYIVFGGALLIVFGGFSFALWHRAAQTPDFFFTRDFFVVAFALLILVGTGVLFWLSYSRTVSNPIINPAEIAGVSVGSDETTLFSIAGIMRMGTFRDRGFRQNFLFFTPQSGRRMNPTAQNAIVASKKRVYFIFVPVGLSDQTTTNTEALEWGFGQKYIQAKLDEMLKSMSLKEIYESNPINFGINFSDIKNIMIKKTGFFNAQDIKFFDRGNNKLEIAVRNKLDLDRAKTFFRQAGLAVAEQ